MNQHESNVLSRLASRMGVPFASTCAPNGHSVLLNRGWQFDDYIEAVAFLSPTLALRERRLRACGELPRLYDDPARGSGKEALCCSPAA